MTKVYNIEVDCANCANEAEEAIKKVNGVKNATVNFMLLKISIEFEDGIDEKETLKEINRICKRIEDDINIYE